MTSSSNVNTRPMDFRLVRLLLSGCLLSVVRTLSEYGGRLENSPLLRAKCK